MGLLSTALSPTSDDDGPFRARSTSNMGASRITVSPLEGLLWALLIKQLVSAYLTESNLDRTGEVGDDLRGFTQRIFSVMSDSTQRGSLVRILRQSCLAQRLVQRGGQRLTDSSVSVAWETAVRRTPQLAGRRDRMACRGARGPPGEKPVALFLGLHLRSSSRREAPGGSGGLP